MSSDLIAIADSHNTDATDQSFKFNASGERFYSWARANVQAAAATAASLDVDAIVQMGDSAEYSETKPQHESLREIQEDLELSGKPVYKVVGNWDMRTLGEGEEVDGKLTGVADYFLQVANSDVLEHGGTIYTDKNSGLSSRFYAFQFGDAIGIVLDTTGYQGEEDAWIFQGDENPISGMPLAPRTYATPDELTWLTNTLATYTTEPLLIFMHYWLIEPTGDIAGLSGFRYTAANASAINAIIEAHQANYGNIMGVVGAHHHPGASAWWYNTTNNEPDEAIYHAAISDFVTKVNDVNHVHLQSPIRGWGNDSDAVDETAANAYYLIQVGQFVTDKWDMKITGYGVNPGGEDKAGDSYLII